MFRAIFKIFLVTLAIFLANNSAYAKTASIADIDLFNTGKRLVLYVSLKDGFSEDVVEAIKSGVPVGITYTVVLKQKIPVLYDKKVVTRTIKRYVKFDTLKEKYKIIDNNGRKTTKRITEDFNEVVRTMAQLDSIHLISNKKLNKKEKYYVNVKAELNSKQTWFPFSYILLFMSYLNFDTSWKSSSPFTFK
tara:strand:+ start:15 stop:587 length:573 start_codon:yes stop_codon:yes gene_type:complete